MTERMKTWIKGFAGGVAVTVILLWICSNDRRTGSEPQ